MYWGVWLFCFVLVLLVIGLCWVWCLVFCVGCWLYCWCVLCGCVCYGCIVLFCLELVCFGNGVVGLVYFVVVLLLFVFCLVCVWVCIGVLWCCVCSFWWRCFFLVGLGCCGSGVWLVGNCWLWSWLLCIGSMMGLFLVVVVYVWFEYVLVCRIVRCCGVLLLGSVGWGRYGFCYIGCVCWLFVWWLLLWILNCCRFWFWVVGVCCVCFWWLGCVGRIFFVVLVVYYCWDCIGWFIWSYCYW